MSMDELADYHAFNGSDIPVTPREIAETEFLRREATAQIEAAKATASAARSAAVAALASFLATLIAGASLIWQHLGQPSSVDSLSQSSTTRHMTPEVTTACWDILGLALPLIGGLVLFLIAIPMVVFPRLLGADGKQLSGADGLILTGRPSVAEVAARRTYWRVGGLAMVCVTVGTLIQARQPLAIVLPALMHLTGLRSG